MFIYRITEYLVVLVSAWLNRLSMHTRLIQGCCCWSHSHQMWNGWRAISLYNVATPHYIKCRKWINLRTPKHLDKYRKQTLWTTQEQYFFISVVRKYKRMISWDGYKWVHLCEVLVCVIYLLNTDSHKKGSRTITVIRVTLPSFPSCVSHIE